jgi:hypothetical protein
LDKIVLQFSFMKSDFSVEKMAQFIIGFRIVLRDIKSRTIRKLKLKLKKKKNLNS